MKILKGGISKMSTTAFWLIENMYIILMIAYILYGSRRTKRWERILCSIVIITITMIISYTYTIYKLENYYIKQHNGVKKPLTGYIVKVDTIKDYPFLKRDIIKYYVKSDKKEDK